MILNKLIGVPENEPFGIRGRAGFYKVTGNSLYRDFAAKGDWEEVSQSVVLGVVLHEAPDNIIYPVEHEHDVFIEPLKACAKLGFYWLSKNRNGECFVSRMQPIIGLHGWFLNTEYIARLNPENILTRMVEWEDPEPVSVLKELNKRNATI